MSGLRSEREVLGMRSGGEVSGVSGWSCSQNRGKANFRVSAVSAEQ